jgi:predicted nucleic acid-binding Zn ribbon protein
LVVLVAALLFSMLQLKRQDYSALANHMAGRTREQLKVMKPCPLCGTLLQPGERVHTVVYSGPAPGARRQDQERPRDSVVHMFGCPYCYPPGERYHRTCPVCGKTIPADGYVVARMFQKNQRKHVHVLGCTECRTR